MNYNKNKMKQMQKEDSMVNFMVKNLIERGHNEDSALEVTFNTQILDGNKEIQKVYMEVKQ